MNSKTGEIKHSWWLVKLAPLFFLLLPLANMLINDRTFLRAQDPIYPVASKHAAGTALSFHLSKAFLASVIPYAVVAGVLILVVCSLAEKMRRRHEESGGDDLSLNHSESGSSAIEFLLIFPLLLITMLTILQIALIVQAKFVVNYAAFAATRSAIVTIPARIRSNNASEERNHIDTENTRSPKMKIITRAAAFPCLAISPRWSTNLLINTGSAYDPRVLLPLQMLRIFSVSLGDGADAAGGMGNQVTSRAMYAYDRNNTSIDISSDRLNGRRIGDHSAITVKVTHRYYLTTPFANRLLGRAYFGGLGGLFSSARYYPITEEFTLLNEGEPLYPQSQQQRFRDSDVELEIY
jgi:hypothetical protein